MMLSARNQLKGVVKSLAIEGIMAEVVVALGGDQEVVSVITASSARRLELEVGKTVTVVIKSTEVMLATDP
ncbi:MAG: TOBE domain-containing protein [Chloroflexi bacterium]|nr:TOBE domain-containing protein [Chloroflexota bacterium]